ncbi:MAG: polysulfide reductase NrfD [Acidobacteria bacterium]|nr:polysulfide reductase NrfD [Acidobacteriota bacterium]
MKEDTAQTAPLPGGVVALLVLVVLAGGAAFLAGVSGSAELSLRAWQIYLVNYVFWTGVTAAGVVLVGIWQVTNSNWGKAFQGVAVAGAGFFPAALLLFLLLIAAGEKLFPWMRETKPHREVWLQPAFVFSRNAVALLVFFVLAGAVVYYRLRPVAAVNGVSPERRAAEQARAGRVIARLAPVLFIVYALVFSLVGFDLVMALDPHWVSTLFGGYIFFGALYAGLAWLAVVAVLFFRRGAAAGLLAPHFLHPVGKLMFGFCMFHGMLFFSQYLPIWYGNLPEEIEFVVVRTHEEPWAWFSLAFLFASLVLPFIILISRPVKKNPRGLLVAALIVLTGMWLDKFVLVVPSLWHAHEVPLGWLEAAITAGFAALVLLCYWGFARFFPLVHYQPEEITSHH